MNPQSSIPYLKLLFLCCLLAASAPAAEEEKESAAQAEARHLGAVRQITFAGAKNGEAYYSPDGRQIVFQGVREPGNPFYQIYRMDLASGQTARISSGAGRTTCAFFHPNKPRMIFASTHLDPASAAKQKEEIEKLKSGPARRYAWDFDPFFDIFECNLDGGNPVRLTEAPGYDAECAYSPDGSRVVFCSLRDGDPEIYVMDSSGQNPTRLTFEKGYDGGPFFSPDGKQILWRHFDDKEQKVAEVWLMDSDGANKRQVTRLGSLSWAPFFHPSMKWIVFASNKDDPAFDVYAIRPDGSELTRLTHATGFDGLPVISPDGRTLLWTSNRADNRSQVFSAALKLPGEAAPAATGTEAGATRDMKQWGKWNTELFQAILDNNLEHETARVLRRAGLRPLAGTEAGPTAAGADETFYIQGPSVIGWLPPAPVAPASVPAGETPAVRTAPPPAEILLVAAGLKRERSSAGDVAALAAAALDVGELRAEGRGFLAAAADADEMTRLYSAVQALLAPKKAGGTPALPTPPTRVAAFVNLAGLASLDSAQLVLRGTGSSSAWRILAERLAARHPQVQFVLEDDPAAAPELQQFVEKGIPALSVGAESGRPALLALEAEIAKAQMAQIERATAAAIDLVNMLARDASLPVFSAYDAAAVKAAARASQRPYLGTMPDYAGAGGAGVKLSGVKEGSPAQKAGLQAGDIVVELGGLPVRTVEDYLKALEALKPDLETEVKVQREGASKTLKVTPGAR